MKQGCLVCSICLRLSINVDREMEDELDWKLRGWPSPAVQLGAAVKHICVSMWSSLQLHWHCKTITARKKMYRSVLHFCFKTPQCSSEKAAQVFLHMTQMERFKVNPCCFYVRVSQLASTLSAVACMFATGGCGAPCGVAPLGVPWGLQAIWSWGYTLS